jgi:hypothetical protein
MGFGIPDCPNGVKGSHLAIFPDIETHSAGLLTLNARPSNANAILIAGFVFCIITVIAAIGRRDAPTAAAGGIAAVVLGILAILSRERGRYDS